MKVKDICYFLIHDCVHVKKINIINDDVPTGFCFHEFIVLAKIAKLTTYTVYKLPPLE